MSEQQIKFDTIQTDYDKAEALRIEISTILKKLCDVMDRARSQGLTLGFNIGLNGNTGRYEFPSPSVARHY